MTAPVLFQDFSRRRFLLGTLKAGALTWIGCRSLLAQADTQGQGTALKHKFLADAGMSFKEVYDFAYAGNLIPVLRGLAEELGRDKFIKLLKKTVSENAKAEGRAFAERVQKNDLATYTRDLRHPSRFWGSVMSFAIIEDTATALEAKILECLWARTFREANASDIGYAVLCHGDFAGVEGFNSSLKLVRTKTLMLGDDCCNHRYVLEI